MEGFACCAKKFGRSPACNKEPRKVSKQGCMKDSTATESWSGVGRDWSQQNSWEVGRLGHFSRV